MRVGPFFRPVASAQTTMAQWRYCYLWLDERGNVEMIEWI